METTGVTAVSMREKQKNRFSYQVFLYELTSTDTY